MVGVREKIKRLVGSVYRMESEAGPTLSFNETASTREEAKTERIGNWPEGRMLRRLAAMRGEFQGKHTFSGPKNLAFLRMLRQAQEQGRAIVVVLPISPVYSKEFLTPDVKREFEEALAKLQHRVPQAQWFRLDQLDELNSKDYFWDLVHINFYGQQIATKAFLTQLRKTSILP